MKLIDVIKLLIAIVAVSAGLFTIISIVKNIGLIIGFISLTFGVLAIIWTARAKFSLSPGSSLYKYTNYLLIILILIVIYSIWRTLREFLNWKGVLVYPEYLFITLVYLVFVFASYKILSISKEFGFRSQVKKIEKIVKKKKR